MKTFTPRGKYLKSNSSTKARFLLLFCSLLFIGNTSFAQNFLGKPINSLQSDQTLNDVYKKFEVFEMNSVALKDYVTSPDFDNNVTLKFSDEFTFDLYLYANDIRSYNFQAKTTEGEILPPTPNVTYAGHEKSSSGMVRMTITDNFITGFIQKDGLLYNIEPASSFLTSVNPDYYIVSLADDLKPHGKTCSSDALDNMNRIQNEVDDVIADQEFGQEKMTCQVIEMGEATDLFMFNTNNGNTTSITTQITTITNLVDGLYNLTYFNCEIEFSIVTLIIATSTATDPWTTSTNSGTLLNNFTNWGPSGFGVSHDIGQLWTTRALDGGGTLGIAWVDGVCTNNRYNVCDKFGGNNITAVVSAHEIGHNLDCPHDAQNSPDIMAPAVQNTSSWSNTSQNRVNATMNTKQCFTDCTSGTTCFTDLTNGNGLGTNENGTVDYESSSFISNTSNVILQSGASIDYDATTYVQLNPNFTVNGGAEFNAFIDGCNNGNGGVNLTGDNTNSLNQTDTDNTPAGSEIELETENKLGKKYIKGLKDNAIKQIEGMR